MSKMRLVMTSLAIAVAGYAAGASAADPSAVLQQSTGRVFVGQTATMIKAQPGMPLYAGNRVVAAAGGGAKVIYPDGCAVSLPENSALAVGKPDQCKAGQATIYTVGGFQNARIGQAGPVNSGEAVATVGEIKGGSTAAGGTATGVGAGVAGATIGGISTGMVVGGLALASAVALGVSSSNDSDNPPASPQALSN